MNLAERVAPGCGAWRRRDLPVFPQHGPRGSAERFDGWVWVRVAEHNLKSTQSFFQRGVMHCNDLRRKNTNSRKREAEVLAPFFELSNLTLRELVAQDALPGKFRAEAPPQLPRNELQGPTKAATFLAISDMAQTSSLSSTFNHHTHQFHD